MKTNYPNQLSNNFSIDFKGGEYRERGILVEKGDLLEVVNLDENKKMRSMVA
jgi:hypothetical protein